MLSNSTGNILDDHEVRESASKVNLKLTRPRERAYASPAAHRDARVVEDHVDGDHREGRRRGGHGAGNRRLSGEISSRGVPGDDPLFLGRESLRRGPDVPVLAPVVPGALCGCYFEGGEGGDARSAAGRPEHVLHVLRLRQRLPVLTQCVELQLEVVMASS